MSKTLATVNGDHFAGHVVSFDEEQHRMCHLFWSAPPAEKSVVCDPLEGGFVVPDRPQGGTRNHCIRTYPGCKFQGELAREGKDSALAYRMSSKAGPWLEG